MNERIQELFKRAGGKTSSRNLASNPVQVVETHELWDDRIEKFAELIVQDCMSMCSELQAQYLTSRKSTMDFDEKNIYAEGEAACDILRHKMKKQFGIEE